MCVHAHVHVCVCACARVCARAQLCDCVCNVWKQRVPSVTNSYCSEMEGKWGPPSCVVMEAGVLVAELAVFHTAAHSQSKMWPARQSPSRLERSKPGTLLQRAGEMHLCSQVQQGTSKGPAGCACSQGQLGSTAAEWRG